MINTIIPDWPAPGHVKAMFTTRHGGVSNGIHGAYATLNLGTHVNDHPGNVAINRALLRKYLPGDPQWLQQVHGADPVWMEQAGTQPKNANGEQGDAALSRQYNTVCAIMVADCLPVFLCDTAGTTVGVVHAGWRGLAAGVIERSIAAMQIDNNQLMAWLGPAIGPDYFEVGDEVRTAFVSHDSRAARAFTTKINSLEHTEKKWFANIFELARQRLASTGVTRIYGGGICTYSDPARFFSYRRDGETGRMAALIWMEKPL
ncbi:peptidoglycan editing factor PgeF [Nitrosomonas sp.]|uniref:peptidoglycan editing factor PgeF n=1 Tax=Nitrosomonas sp. TaxID=42353 RepID=UPI00208863F7|nr:peptidoglycan editing factor PgeF [Nitrosomonas sp.]GJL74975.1 MAG: laccase domain protein [Nitrosomonas sp.]